MATSLPCPHEHTLHYEYNQVEVCLDCGKILDPGEEPELTPETLAEIISNEVEA